MYTENSLDWATMTFEFAQERLQLSDNFTMLLVGQVNGAGRNIPEEADVGEGGVEILTFGGVPWDAQRSDESLHAHEIVTVYENGGAILKSP